MNPVVCIAGPTASGKSAWAVKLAKSVDGEIINADAMQVYADLRVISARPDEAEMDGVPHHLFGHIDGSVRYSTGMWLRDAEPVILDVLARGKVPIVTGGTGLYFKALTQGLAAVPAVDIGPATHILRSQGINALRDIATALDPIATARVLGDDPQRLIRIVSVAQQSGKPLSEWQAITRPVVPNGFWHGAVILPDRQSLYARINARFDMMVDAGGLDEVRALMQRHLSEDLPVMKAIGVQQFKDCLDEPDGLSSAIEIAKRDTRRFAKRQFTWFRGQAKNWSIIEKYVSKSAFEAKFSNL